MGLNLVKAVGGVLLWDVASGRRLARLGGGPALPVTLSFSPDGKTLAVGDSAGGVFLWNVPDPSAAPTP